MCPSESNIVKQLDKEKIARFWLVDVGVDGFRFDAAKHLIEEGQKQENTASTHAWYRDFYKVYKADKPDAFIIGEAFNADAFLASTYTGDQLDMMFDFELASGFRNSANGGGNSAVNSALTFAKESLPGWQFGTFITNHDQNRVMSALNGDLGKARVAVPLLLTSPGVPFLYYGEEIGLTGQKPDADIRRPMRWTAGTNAGFSTGTPWEALGSGPAQANVAAESADPASLLAHYRRLIALRAARRRPGAGRLHQSGHLRGLALRRKRGHPGADQPDRQTCFRLQPGSAASNVHQRRRPRPDGFVWRAAGRRPDRHGRKIQRLQTAADP